MYDMGIWEGIEFDHSFTCNHSLCATILTTQLCRIWDLWEGIECFLVCSLNFSSVVKQ